MEMKSGDEVEVEEEEEEEHTSAWDFPLGVFARAAIGRDIKYIGKKSLLPQPFLSSDHSFHTPHLNYPFLPFLLFSFLLSTSWLPVYLPFLHFDFIFLLQSSLFILTNCVASYFRLAFSQSFPPSLPLPLDYSHHLCAYKHSILSLHPCRRLARFFVG